ncbi:Transthyretin-like family protein [Trichuris suis]|nr:Transthyretin-like family protein [Trichuris suis]
MEHLSIVAFQQNVRVIISQFELLDTIKDDTLSKAETGNDGSFHLDGTDDEMGTIEPQLKIYHRCLSRHVCKRRWVIKIPDKYISAPGGPDKVFDIGTVNLEINLEEDKKCLPV